MDEVLDSYGEEEKLFQNASNLDAMAVYLMAELKNQDQDQDQGAEPSSPRGPFWDTLPDEPPNVPLLMSNRGLAKYRPVRKFNAAVEKFRRVVDARQHVPTRELCVVNYVL